MFPMSRVAKTSFTSHGTHQGRSLNTKIHAVVTARSQAVVIAMSGGNQADIFRAEDLRERLPEDSTLIGDKAYDSSTAQAERGH